MDSAIQITGWFVFFGCMLGYLVTSDPKRRRMLGWVSIVLAAGLSIEAATPLADRELIPFFEKQAAHRDEAFQKMMTDVRSRSYRFKGSQYTLLKNAIEEHKLDLRDYFAGKIRVPADKQKSVAASNEFILLEMQKMAGGKVRLGLDLKGGSSFLLEVDTKGDTHILDEATKVLHRRVDALGLAEPIVQPVGSNRILVQLPGVSEAQREMARKTVQQPAYLEFRLVHPDNASLRVKAAQDPTLVVPGYKRFDGVDRDEQGREIRVLYFLDAVPRLKGDALARAFPDLDEYGRYQVAFELKSQATERFARLTEEHVGEQLAILLDGEVHSAPVIRSAITGGRGVIEGSFTRAEVLRLSMVLNNPLSAPARLIEERNVDASLGKDSIRSGVNAGIAGAIAVIIFMAIYYLATGVIADVAVSLNLVILVGILALFEFTLTLPGLAGIILTIGMAVDANVLINERIREEMRAGKGLKGAIQAGYGKAFWTIFDSNVTTLITAIILIMLGSGPVKGFGITLTIGLCVSMFTALVGTRLIVDFLVARGWLKSLPMLHIIRDAKFDFVGKYVYAFCLSAILILAGMFVFVQRRGIEGLVPRSPLGDKIMSAVHTVIPARGTNIYGIDFKGGVALTLDFEQDKKIEMGAVRRTLEGVGITDNFIQYQRELTTGREILQIKTAPIDETQVPKLIAAGISADTIKEGTGKTIEALLKQAFPQAQFSEAAMEEVGSVVSQELKWEAILAVAVACVLIMIYVALRFEFGFGLGAVAALVHDALITVGFFALSGRQFSLPMVAAILTVVGYSINDTIVVFDRIREDLKLHGGRARFRDLINRSINETLARTLITSGTTLMACLALYLLGGGVINDFAFTLLVGIITGTYSTMFIAAPVVLWWERRQRARGGIPASSAEPQSVRSV